MIRDVVKKNIQKLVGTLKKEEELLKILKARLTKREYKMLLGWSGNASIEEISQGLKLDAGEYDVISRKLIKKLNQEKIKQELSEN